MLGKLQPKHHGIRYRHHRSCRTSVFTLIGSPNQRSNSASDGRLDVSCSTTPIVGCSSHKARRRFHACSQSNNVTRAFDACKQQLTCQGSWAERQAAGTSAQIAKVISETNPLGGGARHLLHLQPYCLLQGRREEYGPTSSMRRRETVRQGMWFTNTGNHPPAT
jgi:hypothetical protein